MYDIVIWLQVYNIFNMYIYIHIYTINIAVFTWILMSQELVVIQATWMLHTPQPYAVSTHPRCICVQNQVLLYIYRHWWACIFLVSTSVCSYDMDGKQVAHANTYAHGPHVLCICNGILSGLNATITLWLPLTLIIRNGMGNSNLPFLQKYVFFLHISK